MWAGMKDNRFYVYIYLDPRKPGDYRYGSYAFDHEPFYVGKGKQYKRKKDRDMDVNDHKHGHVRHKIRAITNDGKKPIVIRIFDGMKESDAFREEQNLIRLIGRQELGFGPLTNHTDGGEGCSGIIVSEEVRNRISKTMKNGAAPFKGKLLSKEHREKMSEAHKKLTGEKANFYGKTHSDETKKKLSAKLKGRIISLETRKRMSEGRRGDKHHRCWLGKQQSKQAILKRTETRKLNRQKEGYIDPLKGRKISEKNRKKLAIAIRRSWIKRRQKYGPTGQPLRATC